MPTSPRPLLPSLAHVQFNVVPPSPPSTPLAEGLNLELQSFSGAQVMLLNCPDPQQLHYYGRRRMKGLEGPFQVMICIAVGPFQVRIWALWVVSLVLVQGCLIGA